MIIIVWGVAGSGKTTIGKALAAKMSCCFFDADDYHSTANIEKMSGGQPLTDADRLPWLNKLRELVDAHEDSKGAVLACSALRASYRGILGFGLPHVRSVLLDGPKTIVASRLLARTDHFMPTTLLESQFEVLDREHEGLTLSIEQSPEDLVQAITQWLENQSRAHPSE